MATKQCTYCKAVLPREMFWNKRNRRDGKNERCAKCAYALRKATMPASTLKKERDRSRQWALDHPDITRMYKRRTKLTTKYGITEEFWHAYHSERQGCCDICHRQCTAGPTHPLLQKCSLEVDHCHRTGDFRGLLCRKCNTAIGLLADDPGLLETAARYLRRHGIKALKA